MKKLIHSGISMGSISAAAGSNTEGISAGSSSVNSINLDINFGARAIDQIGRG